MGIVDIEIYHGILFDNMGRPWGYDENGLTKPIEAGDTDDSLETLLSTVTNVSYLGGTVRIEGHDRLDFLGTLYEGDVVLSYTLLPDGSLDLSAEALLSSSDGTGYHMTYDGNLQRTGPFPQPS